MLRPIALAEIGALLGDPARANMLDSLMDGRALTARELACVAGVAPQTASGHLAKLVEAGMVVVRPQGRHRYHRLASADVAQLIEAAGRVASRTDAARHTSKTRTGPRDEAMRAARTCYDHFAGRLGVAIADAMQAARQVELDDDGGTVTPAGRGLLERLGVEVGATRERRLFCRPCLDWSERRPHLAGKVGTAIACRCFALGWVVRLEGTRAVRVTPKGQLGLREAFAIGGLTAA